MVRRDADLGRVVGPESVKQVGEPGEYQLIGNNCQDWADRVHDQYEGILRQRAGFD